jgi:amino acid permease
MDISRSTSILVCCMLAIPVVIPSKLSALKYVTPISTVSLLVTAVAVVYRTPSLQKESSGDIDLVIISRGILKGFAITVSSFICHTNVVAVAGELVQPTERRADKIALRSALVQLILYLVIAVCGYLSFRQGIQQNFLKGYPDDDKLIASCRVLLSFTIFFGIPMNTNPTAKAIVNLWESLKSRKADTLLPSTPSDRTDPMRKLRIISGVIVLIIGAIISLQVPGIADVIGILGGSLGTLIMLVFPAIIFSKVYRDDMHKFQNRFFVCLLLTASAVCFSSVIITVISV